MVASGDDWPGGGQFGKKAAKHMGDFIRGIRNHPDEVRLGPWNPSAQGASDYVFYRKGADVVVTKSDGEFVTILKGGVDNSWYQGAASK
jgi:hypothetical protein